MFRNLIKERRLEMNLSQTKVAILVGIATPTLSDVELGKRLPWPRLKRSLSRVLKLAPDVLFPDDEGGNNG